MHFKAESPIVNFLKAMVNTDHCHHHSAPMLRNYISLNGFMLSNLCYFSLLIEFVVSYLLCITAALRSVFMVYVAFDVPGDCVTSVASIWFENWGSWIQVKK